MKQTTCEYQLGGAANVAKQLKRLGANVILFGIIGNDENGKMFKKLLKQEGLEVDFYQHIIPIPRAKQDS